MVKKKVLDIDRESVRLRMEAGEQMGTAAVWKATETGTYKWAYATLSNWYKAGLIHVARWQPRIDGGMPQAIYAWGPGKDAHRPDPVPIKERARRYREALKADPERYAQHCARRTLRDRKTPFMDPIHAAMLGYRRHGKGWMRTEGTSNEE